MTTSSHRAATLAQIPNQIRAALTPIAPGADWRKDALERAADYAEAGQWRESRRMAEIAREGN